MLHFWATEVQSTLLQGHSQADPKGDLQRAYNHTTQATAPPNEWFGTTTTSGALLSSTPAAESNDSLPILRVTQLGDSKILVIRPRTGHVIYRTQEQWHWFDCPRQLGTNSPDTPTANAVVDEVQIEALDIVLAMSDGVIDNLWEHEVVASVLDSLENVESSEEPASQERVPVMQFVASELVKAARKIAEDPYAECPYMERAVEEGLPIEGGMSLAHYNAYEDDVHIPGRSQSLTLRSGKLDDISVIAAQCRKRAE